MRLLRGALTFFSIVAIFAVVTCKKETGPPSAGVARLATSGDPTTSSCKNDTTGMSWCGNTTADCTITVNVSTANDDVTVSPDKVIVPDSRKVFWHAQEDGAETTTDKVKIKRVHFAESESQGDTKPKKKNKNFVNEADCKAQANGDCKKDSLSEFCACNVYDYTIVVQHRGHPKQTKDPEIEVATTTGAKTATDTTGTGSTSGTSGTH